MTEAEWLACEDPESMLGFLMRESRDRKLRLFACACCRRLWPLFIDERSRKALEFAEQHADAGIARRKGRPTVRAAAWEAQLALAETNQVDEACAALAAVAVVEADLRAVVTGCCCWSIRVSERQRPQGQERGRQVALLRDLLGNPFGPVSRGPIIRAPAVIPLAQATYDERALPSGELDPARLAVLADALEEAGSTDDAILTHLRAPGPHVRGCWALDLILGKS